MVPTRTGIAPSTDPAASTHAIFGKLKGCSRVGKAEAGSEVVIATTM